MDRYPVLTAGRPARVEPEPVPTPRARWTPWMVLLGFVSLATTVAIVGISIGPFSRGGNTAAPPPRGDRRPVAVAYVDVEGGVRPLFPAVPGRVIEAPVDEGQEVEAGKVLLRIDD